MVKKFAGIVTAGILMLSLVACGKGDAVMENGETEPVVDEKSLKAVTAQELLSVYDFDIDEYVTLGEYKNLDIQLEGDYKVEEEDVIAYLDSYLAYSASYNATDKQDVEEGDIVNIDYVGTIGGEAFEGGTDDGAHLEIGSNSFITGFEAGLVGHKVGEEVILDLKFPDDYWNEEYAGKDVTFTVKINSIDEAVNATYNTVDDTYVHDTYGYDSKQAWYDATLSSLKNSQAQQKESDAQAALIEKIMENSTVQVPGDLVEKEIDETVRQATLYAKQNLDGMSFEDYLKEYEACDSVDTYRDKIRGEVEETLKSQLVVDAIIKKENTSITEGGYNDFLKYYLDMYGLEEKDFYERYGSKESIQLIYAENLVIGQLVDDVVAKNPD